MTYSELQTAVFEILGFTAGSDDEVLTVAQVKTALTGAHRWLAGEVGLYRRTATIPALADTAAHPYPLDLVSLLRVTYSGSTYALTYIPRYELDNLNATWWDADAGTPTHWYQEGDTACGLYPPPLAASSETVGLYGVCVPWNVGDGVATFSRTTTVLTITTTAAHNLRVGDRVTASGCATAAFNAAYVVVSVPTSTTFTATVADSGATSGLVANLAYTGGVLPLIADTDVPTFSAGSHLVLAYRAALVLATTKLQTDPTAQAALPGIVNLLKEGMSALKVRNLG